MMHLLYENTMRLIGSVIPSAIISMVASAIIMAVLQQIRGERSSETDNKLLYKIYFIIFALVTIGIFSRSLIRAYWGEHRIGSFFESYAYTTQYYVHAFPDNDPVTNYRLIAEIDVSFETDDGYDDDESSTTYRYISLRKLVFPNGDYITFYDSYESLKVGEKVYMVDDVGGKWEIELTKIRVK